MISANFLVKVDKVCDYIPIVSTATNLVNLFQKTVVLPFMDAETIASNHYYTYLNEKNVDRCIILTIPVIGNILVALGEKLGDFLLSRDLSERTGVPWNSDDKESVLASMKRCPEVVMYASKRLKNDEDVVLFAVQRMGWIALDMIGEKKWAENEEIMEAIKAHPGFNIEDFEESIYDKLHYLHLHKDHGSRFCDNSCKPKYRMNDYLFRWALFKPSRKEFEDFIKAHNYPCDNKEFMLLGVKFKSRGWLLQFASDRLKDDKEVVLAAVKSDKEAVKYASTRLQDDVDVKDAAKQLCCA